MYKIQRAKHIVSTKVSTKSESDFIQKMVKNIKCNTRKKKDLRRVWQTYLNVTGWILFNNYKGLIQFLF